MTETQADIRAAALDYAARGLRVLPIRAGEKAASIREAPDKATTDPEQIERWFPDGQVRRKGVGIMAGPGLCIVDVDPRNGGDVTWLAWVERWPEFGAMPFVRTPSGGWHVYLSLPDGLTLANGEADGIDVQASRKYVLAPPTILPSGAYTGAVDPRPAPAAWVAWWQERGRPAAAGGSREGRPTSDDFPKPPWADVERACGWLRWVADPVNQQQQKVSQTEWHDALCVVTHCQDGIQVAHEISRQDPRYRPDECQATAIRSRDADMVIRCDTAEAKGYGCGACRTCPHRGQAGSPLQAARGYRPRDPLPLDVAAEFPPELTERPKVCWDRDIATAADTAEKLLARLPEVYQRRGELVEEVPGPPPALRALPAARVRVQLSRAARWYTVNADGDEKNTSVPREVSDGIHAAGQWPSVRPVERIETMPACFRADGSLVAAPGYDRAERVLLRPAGPALGQITEDDPRGSFERLWLPFAEFPFRDDVSRANLLAMLVGIVLRPCYSGPAPMYLISAPTAGTGKSLLAQAAGALITGRTLPMSTWPRTDEEVAKAMLAHLQQGAPLIVWDNVARDFDSPELAAWITSGELSGRVLGSTRVVSLPMRAQLVATGNNLGARRDMVRRCVRVVLDTEQERPAERQQAWTCNPLVPWILEHRGELLAGLFGLCRAWIAAGRPVGATKPLGSFEGWSETTAGVLGMLGMDSLLLADREELWEVDDSTNSDALLLAELARCWPDEAKFSAAEAIKGALVDDQLAEAMPFGVMDSNTLGGARKLNGWLRKLAGRPLGGLRLVGVRVGGVQKWLVAGGEPGGQGPKSGGEPGGQGGQERVSGLFSLAPTRHLVSATRVSGQLLTTESATHEDPCPPCPPDRGSPDPRAHLDKSSCSNDLDALRWARGSREGVVVHKEINSRADRSVSAEIVSVNSTPVLPHLAHLGPDTEATDEDFPGLPSATPLDSPAMVVALDLETRSAVDLRKSGPWRYAEDASTGIICLVACIDGKWLCWAPADITEANAFTDPAAAPGDDCTAYRGPECPAPLREAIEAGATVTAHNAEFEAALWSGVAVARYGWPEVARWECSAARCSAAGLPAGLDMAAKALRLPGKDDGGAGLIKRFSLPQKGGGFAAMSETDLAAWWRYCRQDVQVELDVHERTKALDLDEAAVWQAHLAVNRRGVHADQALADQLQAVGDELTDRAAGAVEQATQGAVGRADLSRVTFIRDWLASRGLETGSGKLTADDLSTLEALAASRGDDPALAVVRGRQAVSRASLAKLGALEAMRCADGRVRGTFRYWEAHPGRWTGRGIQPHNLPRPAPGLDVDAVIAAALANDADAIEALAAAAGCSAHGALASCLRGCLVAAPGFSLVAADYSAIEARGVLWLAGDPGLADFAEFDQGRGAEPYRIMAAQLLGITPDQVAKGPQRSLGKVGILGCGYGMGAARTTDYAAGMGVDLQALGTSGAEVVQGYRAKYPGVPALWRALEDGWAWCLEHPDKPRAIRPAKLLWMKYRSADGCMLIRLPSARVLVYRGAKMTADGPAYWSRRYGVSTTWGGTLTENVTQAACRDLLAHTLDRAEAEQLDPVLHVHDELVLEVAESEAQPALDRLIELMTTEAPAWAEGFPIAAEGWHGKRYGKG